MKLGALVTSALALASAACGDDSSNPGGDDDPTASSRDFTLRIENVARWTVLKTGTQATRTTGGDGPAGSGEAFEIRFTAGDHQFLSFAAMMFESNDWFFAPGPEGIPLYTDGRPTSGDVTSYVRLWDAGTEYDQEPSVGDATGGRQPSRTTGEPDPDINVREVELTTRLGDGRTFVRPEVADMIRVTLTPGADQQFTLRIQNVSGTNTLITSWGPRPLRISPFAWAIHEQPAPLFTPGEPARENGLELLAEAGLPDTLGTALRNVRGYASALSPGLFVVHEGPAPLFALGEPDRGLGLEQLAEDGDPEPLRAAFAADLPGGVFAFDTFGTEPIGPGETVEATFHAGPGDYLSFAAMFRMSNDWFFATRPEGIALFLDGSPVNCDVTSDVILYDLGTEADEELNVGPNTAPQQLEPGAGRPDRFTEVREVTPERYGIPTVLHLRVTLTPR